MIRAIAYSLALGAVVIIVGYAFSTAVLIYLKPLQSALTLIR